MTPPSSTHVAMYVCTPLPSLDTALQHGVPVSGAHSSTWEELLRLTATLHSKQSAMMTNAVMPPVTAADSLSGRSKEQQQRRVSNVSLVV